MNVSIEVWIRFIMLIVILLIVDLKVVMRGAEEINTKKAGIYSAVWISLGLAFTGVVAWWNGANAA